MVAQIKKDVATGIVDFLKKSIQDGTITGDDKESLEVAMDCISEVFAVDESKTQDIYGQESLESLVLKLQASGSVGKTRDTATEKPNTVKPAEVSPETKQIAETYKIEGNRAMAQKKFQEAIESYTKAIETDPTNAIYLSNRSAAYSSIRESSKAAEDARKAIELDPSYSKAYSRLGLSLYSMGDAEGAMKAYEDGLKAEGDSPSDGMRKGYETAKKRVQEDLEQATTTNNSSGNNARSTGEVDASRGTSDGPGASGDNLLGDLSRLMGSLGGAGGSGNIMMDMFNNPQIQNLAQQFMGSNPGAMSEIMADPQAAMRRHLGTDDVGSLLNSDLLRNLGNFGGQGGQGGQGNQGSEGSN